MPAKSMRIVCEDKRSIPKRINFTATSIAAVKPPKDSDRAFVYDVRTPGLALMITAAGARTFYRYQKVNGRPQRIKLGRFPDITVEQARKLAQRAAADISEGLDPQAEKRAARAEMKFGDLFKWFIKNHAKPHKRSWSKDQQRYDKHISKWKSRPLSAITREEVQRLHLSIGKTRPGAANRVLALLSTVFNKARLIGYDAPNPVAGVPRFKENSRERFITAEEMPRFFAALDAEPDQTWKDYFYTCLWTGARSGNVKSMRWSEINLKAGTWAIPADKFKTGDAMTVHLSTEALEILKRRQDRSYQRAGNGMGGDLRAGQDRGRMDS